MGRGTAMPSTAATTTVARNYACAPSTVPLLPSSPHLGLLLNKLPTGFAATAGGHLSEMIPLRLGLAAALLCPTAAGSLGSVRVAPYNPETHLPCAISAW